MKKRINPALNSRYSRLPRFSAKHQSTIGIINESCGRFEPALRFLEKGLIQTEPLISRIFPFNELESAFSFAQKDDTLKVLLRMN